MNRAIHVAAACTVDVVGVRNSAGTTVDWQQLDVDPQRSRIAWREEFGGDARAFRRLDPTTRMVWIAAAACGLDELPEPLRERTGLVLASASGCLAADLRFAAGLHVTAGIEPALFAYTLPSTALGEVAIRHRLRGPTLFLSVPSGREAAGVDAGLDLISAGEADAALVLCGGWLPAVVAEPVGAVAETRIDALLLRPAEASATPTISPSDGAALLEWARSETAGHGDRPADPA